MMQHALHPMYDARRFWCSSHRSARRCRSLFVLVGPDFVVGVGSKQMYQHRTDVAEAALSEHRHAICERSDGVRQILRGSFHDL